MTIKEVRLPSVYVVVVIYNQYVDDSTTLRSLESLARREVHVIVVDNSTRPYDNELACTERGWTYLCSHCNAGLSKAYNRALDYLSHENGVVIWMDDDSTLTNQYFTEVEGIFANDLADIAVPVICAQDGRFYSPNEAGFFKNHQIKSAGQQLSQKRFNAINSCTAVSLRVYEHYRYDERLFLDQVDQKFFDDQRERGMRFFKMDTIISHNLSVKGEMDAEKVMRRYDLRISDFHTYCIIQGYSILAFRLKVALWGLAEYSKSRDARLLRYFFSRAIHPDAIFFEDGHAAGRSDEAGGESIR